MADQIQIVAAGVRAGGRAEAGGVAGAGGDAGAGARGEAGAGAGGRRDPGRVCTTHHLPWLKENPNHGKPLKGQSKKDKKQEDVEIKLTARFRVGNQEVNMENEKLVVIYNCLIDISKHYTDLVKFVGKDKSQQMDRLKINFTEVSRKIKPQQAAVRRIGGEPMPFPGAAFRNLSKELKLIMKEQK